MPKNKIKTVIILFFITMFILGVFFLTFNNDGIIKYVRLRKQLDSLNIKIDSVSQNNQHLQFEIDSLNKKVPAKIEKVAREKYNMIRKGEKEIKILEK